MQSTDLKVYKSLDNGRCSAVALTSGSPQNVFPHVTSAQRQAGLVDYAKIHFKVADINSGTLIDPAIYIDKPTPADGDYVVCCLLGQRDPLATLATTVTAAQKYGSAVLAADIGAGDSTFSVTLEHADLAPGGADEIFRDADAIRICSHTDALATNGAEEDKIISGTPTLSGLTLTITVTTPFVNNFTADGTARCSSMIQPGDIAAVVDSITTVVGSGLTNQDTAPITLDGIGCVEQDWTIDFTDPTHFTVSGDTLGVVGSGVVGSELILTNGDFSRPYMTIPAGFFTGTWAAGDQVTLTTHPASVPIGQKRRVLAGAASFSNNRVSLVQAGEAN